MKKMMKLAMAVALTAFAAACSNQDDMPNNEKGSTEFSVEGVINGYEEVADSRAEAQTVVRIKWNGNETVYVYDGISYIGSLTAQPDANNAAIAKLSGTLNSAPSGNPLTLVYSPLFTEKPTVTGGKLTLDLSEQSTSKVPFLIYGVLTNLDKDVDNKVVSFNFATSVYKCNGGNLDTAGTISLAAIDNINTKCVLTLSDGAAPTVGGEEVGTIIRTTGFTSADERAIFTFALPVSDEATERTITVFKNDKEHTATFSKSAIAAAQSFNGVYVFEEASNDDYVEIGGVRWATKNLGATTVAGSYLTCAGDFYQWGSLNTLYSAKTLTADGKWSFTWRDGKTSGFTSNNREYKTDASLPDAKDVVMQNMAGWRMPTVADFKALFDACSDNVTKQSDGINSVVPEQISSSTLSGGVYLLLANQTYLLKYRGIAGILFVDKNDTSKRVFFPFAATSLSNVPTSDYPGNINSPNCYETKDYHSSGGYCWYIKMDRQIVNNFYGKAQYGRAIRPVQDIN